MTITRDGALRCVRRASLGLIWVPAVLQLSCVLAARHDKTTAPEAARAPEAAPPPPQGPRQPPRIVDDSIEIHLGTKYHHGTNVVSPILKLAYLGDSKTDDRVLLKYSLAGQQIGSVVDCAVEPHRESFPPEDGEAPPPPRGTLDCSATYEQVALAVANPGTYDLDLTYRLTAEGTEVQWRHLTFDVDSFQQSQRDADLMVNRDRDLAQGWLTLTDERRLYGDPCTDIRRVRLSFRVSPATTDPHGEPSVIVGRCYVGGAQVGEDQTSNSHSKAFGVRDARTGEQLMYVDIRISSTFLFLAPDQRKCLAEPRFAARVKRGEFIATHPGQWECKVTLDGKLARAVHFTVDRDGQIPLHEEQIGDGALVSLNPADRFVDVDIIGDYDRERARRRIGGSAFFGRPWKSARLRATQPDAP